MERGLSDGVVVGATPEVTDRRLVASLSRRTKASVRVVATKARPILPTWVVLPTWVDATICPSSPGAKPDIPSQRVAGVGNPRIGLVRPMPP